MNIILSIKPKWAELIYSGKKTIEWRKSFPKLNSYEDFKIEKVFLYETAPVKKITGYFEFNENSYPVYSISDIDALSNQRFIENGCVPKEDLKRYKGKNNRLYGWIVGNVTKFKVPFDLVAFNLKRPPQSWCYDTTFIRGVK